MCSTVNTLARVAEERQVSLGFGVLAFHVALSLIGNALVVFFVFSRVPSGAAGLPPTFRPLSKPSC
jgi:hypothetical protein